MMTFILYSLVYSLLIWIAFRILTKVSEAHHLLLAGKLLLGLMPLCFFMPSFFKEDILVPKTKIETPLPMTKHHFLSQNTRSPLEVKAKQEVELQPQKTPSFNLGLSVVYFLCVSVLLLQLYNSKKQLNHLKQASKQVMNYRGIPVWEHNLPISPMAAGILSPSIFVPEQLINKLDQPALNSILHHEWVHIRKGDIILNLYLNFLKIIFFFSPFIYLIIKDVKQSMEERCDKIVLKNGNILPKTYGSALLFCQMFLKTFDNPLVSSQELGKSELRRRIESFRDLKKTNLRMYLAVILAFPLLVACINPSSGVPNLSEPMPSEKRFEGIVFWDDQVYDEFFNRHR